MADDDIAKIVKSIPQKGNRVQATIDKNALKLFFHFFSKKPDTISKSFFGNKIITKDDILDLSKMVAEKLKLHSVKDAVFSVIISFKNNKTLTYGSLTQFQKHPFDEPDIIENIIIKYDFLLDLDDDVPKRYYINIRISGNMSPILVLRSIFSQDPTDIDNIDDMMPSCIVNIGFIDSRMSTELMQLVEDWHKSLRRPVIEGKIIEWIKKHDDITVLIGRYFAVIVGIIIASMILLRYKFNILVNFEEYKKVAIVLLIFAGIIYVFNRIGKIVARKFVKIINRIGELPVFQITKGDKSNVDKIAQKNTNSKIKVIIGYIVEFVIGCLASWVVWKLTK
jgi:hypothetical protein